MPLLLLMGCRQLLGIEGGEVVPDAASPNDAVRSDSDGPVSIGHDEDNDGIADTMDNCPTIANTSQDVQTAGEAVGAACDPRTANGDHVGVFFSFELPERPPDAMGGQTFEMDHATISGGELATKASFDMVRGSVIFSQTTPPVGSGVLELRFGSNLCRIGPCSGTGTYCLQATGLNATSEVDVSLGTKFRFDMTQLADAIRCDVYAATPTPTTAMVDASTGQEDRLRVRATSTTATIDSLILYDVP